MWLNAYPDVSLDNMHDERGILEEAEGGNGAKACTEFPTGVSIDTADVASSTAALPPLAF
jgi:hypothetical protein